MSQHKALLWALGMAFILTAMPACQGTVPTSAPPDKDTETYAVYSVLIADVGGLPVVSNRAGGVSWRDSDYDRVHDEIAEVDRPMWDDLTAANDHAEQLQGRFDPGLGGVVLANWADLGVLFSKNKPEEAWAIFLQKYPGKCLLSLSNVGFSDGLDEALVYVSRTCDATTGSGKFYYLAKERGKWVVRGAVILWGY